jgi:hypothetical protein
MWIAIEKYFPKGNLYPALCMEKRRGVCWVFVGNLTKRDHLQDPAVDGSIILTWIFRKWDLGL